MCKGFQITCFSNQQFSIVSISKLVDTFNLEVKEKISWRIRHSNVIINKHCASASATRDMQNLTIQVVVRITNLKNDALL